MKTEIRRYECGLNCTDITAQVIGSTMSAAVTKMSKSRGAANESLVERFEWIYLVATAAGGASVVVDVLLFEHQHMDVIGVIAFASVATAMSVLALLEHKKGRK